MLLLAALVLGGCRVRTTRCTPEEASRAAAFTVECQRAAVGQWQRGAVGEDQDFDDVVRMCGAYAQSWFCHDEWVEE
jgi:hypothetical protein